MSQIVIITSIGSRDQPGIISGLTEAVYAVGGNLDDATMTRLHGAFATMLSAEVKNESDVDLLRSKLKQVSTDFGLYISVEPIPDEHVDLPPDHQINVYGADQPGIVFHVTSLLAELGVNVTDLDTRLAGAPGNGVYVMLLETSGGDWSKLPYRLAELAIKLGIEVSHREIESEAL